MNFKQLATSIASFAPTLATMLGGPLAGVAVSALAGALGLKPEVGADAVTQAIQTATLTPDQLVAIRTADQKHAEVLGEQGIDLAKLNADHEEAFAKIEAEDRASAREREIGVKDNTPRTLAYLTTFGFFAAFIGCLFVSIPESSKAIIFTMIGSLGTVWINQQGYYFGSSAGSASKTDTINKIAAAAAK